MPSHAGAGPSDRTNIELKSGSLPSLHSYDACYACCEIDALTYAVMAFGELDGSTQRIEAIR